MSRSFAFVSYSSKNEDVVEAIVKRLRNSRFDISTFRDNPGGVYTREIAEEIENCDLFILMASAQSNDSTDVENEVTMAKDAGLTILKLELDKAGREAHKYLTASLSAVPMLDGADDANYANVKRFVAKHVRQRPREQDRSQVQSALAWLKPHLVNRTAQENAVAQFVRDPGAQHEIKPVMFLLHGAENDCPDNFVHRLANHTLPDKFNRKESHGGAKLDQFDWPPSRGGAEAGNENENEITIRTKDLERQLQEKTLAADEEDAWALVLDLHLTLEYWQKTDTEILERFLAQWQKSPPTTRGNIPVILIARVSFGENVIEALFWLSRRWRIINLFRKHLHAGRASGGQIAILPPLNRIRFVDACAWINKYTSDLSEQDPDANIRRISPSFRIWLGVWRRRLSMKQTVDILKPLLIGAPET